MAWTAPKTWVTSEVVTAAQMNAHVRDNMLETSTATATTAGDLVYADGNKSMGSRLAIGAGGTFMASTGTAPVWRVPATDVDTVSGTTTSGTYQPLSVFAGGGFATEIEVTCTTGTTALVLWKGKLSNSTAGELTLMSYAVSGATTVAAADIHCILYESGAANDGAMFAGFDLRTGLTAGSNTFTLTGRVSNGIGTIAYPEICVIPY